MVHNPFEAFLKTGENAEELSETYLALVARNSPTPLYLSLPQKEQQLAQRIASEHDVQSYTDALQFGQEAQQNVKAFANQLFSQMKKSDSDKINRILYTIVDLLQQIDPDHLKPAESGFFKRLFQKRSNASVQQTISTYKRISKQIDRLAIELEHAQQALQRHYALLATMYENNKQHFMHINVFIASIELKLQQLREVTRPQLEADVATLDDVFGSMSLQDLDNAIEWLDRRKYDLEVSREITLQAVPQIQMTQATNQMLMEKIQSSILATIPMWQTQISTILALGNQAKLQQSQKRMDQLNEQMAHTNLKNVQHVSQAEQIDELKETQSSLVEDILDVISKTVESSETTDTATPKKTRRYNGK